MPGKKSKKVRILDDPSIRSKIARIAYEIWERNYAEKKVLILGIDRRGGVLGEMISQKLESISPLKVKYAGLKKKNDGLEIEEKILANDVTDRPVVIVDDVMYSGKTIFNALSIVVPQNPSKVQTAVLIDRGHRNLPVDPDFVGTDLETTLLQHVSVEINKDASKIEAYLQ